MSYQFATENINYEDYSSGRVFYNQQGTTAFPIRLASEIFLRCKDVLEKEGKNGPFTVYDPLCGGAYALTSLGFLYGSHISKIYASDANETAVELAKKNLSLLTREGLEERKNQIERLFKDFKKDSHKEALNSISKFRNINERRRQPIETHCFLSDALKLDRSTTLNKVDIVITDIPYGEVVDWLHTSQAEIAPELLLNNLLPILSNQSVIAVTATKKSKIRHENYRKIMQFNLGKRQTVLLIPEIL